MQRADKKTTSVVRTVVAGVPRDRPDDGLRVIYLGLPSGDYELQLRLTEKSLNTASNAIPDFKPPTEPIVLARYTVSAQTLTTFPVSTNFNEYFIKPKYQDVTTVIYDDVDPISNLSDGDRLYFEELPSGFIREPLAGFGLNYDMRFIIDAVEGLGGISTLRLSRVRGLLRTGETLTMPYSAFDEFRRAINRTHRVSVGLANKAKADYLNANLSVMLDPSYRLAEGDGTARPVADILAEILIGKARSPEAEAKAATRTVKKSVKTLIEKEPAELLDLGREIELVSLEELIDLFQDRLDRDGLQERHWQDFFNRNAFILQLAFNLPALALGDQVSVGGTRFDGSGGKLADYAMRLGLFGNLALVEIKTPKTKLLENVPYRGGVFGPTKELSGSINQVLDQRHQLQSEINNKKISSRTFDVFAYAIQCIVIAGRQPSSNDQKKSLELYRNNLRDVVVITFDELLWKLRSLHEFLTKAPDSVTELSASDR